MSKIEVAIVSTLLLCSVVVGLITYMVTDTIIDLKEKMYSLQDTVNNQQRVIDEYQNQVFLRANYLNVCGKK